MNQRPARSPRSCFIDTSAYFALANRRDANHARARLALERLAAAATRIYTTNFILAETHTLLLNRMNRAVAYAFVQRLYEGATTIVRVSRGDEQRAWDIVGRYEDKDFTLTDATSFAVMDRLRIEQALTLDAAFARYGLAIIALEQP